MGGRARHVALLGDSILDNRPYTAPAPDTADTLRQALGDAWTVDLLARDGAVMLDIEAQLRRLPLEDATGVLSIGGNDALEHLGFLERRASSVAEVLDELDRIADAFGERYRRVLAAVGLRVGRLIVCTIYEPPLLDATVARLARVPLTLFNDLILRAAVAAGHDVLDLRTVCTEPGDFVQDIEPSATGAVKIAGAIHGALTREPPGPVPRIFGR